MSESVSRYRFEEVERGITAKGGCAQEVTVIRLVIEWTRIIRRVHCRVQSNSSLEKFARLAKQVP